ncbi:hypothetical protein [Levilactobacillus humaensis]|uniref:hypothetical protein n=1 Tax=Levilactobacillus humaensis TaxID=2950375 RepID=UPI0021C33A71|nr:hypothetical protein [Levilactobacillus humaensis]
MSKILQPTFGGGLKMGMLDFFVFLFGAVTLILNLSDQTNHLIWGGVFVVFALSTLFTVLGLWRGKLYHDFEIFSVLILQIVFTGLLLNFLL